jgi:hypothetical protein
VNPADARADPALTVLRQRRAELRESMSALESALAAPGVGRVDYWTQRVAVAVVELSADFTTHIAITEGPDGLHRNIVDTAPRLAHAVEKLSAEHAVIVDRIEDLLRTASSPPLSDGVNTIREQATSLLGLLARHRQRGADLIFEAYEADIGGET